MRQYAGYCTNINALRRSITNRKDGHMIPRKEPVDENAPYMTMGEAAKHFRVNQQTLRKTADEAGAVVFFSKRVVRIDMKKLTDYIRRKED